jgi:HlyD family secretion protein
VPKQSLTGNSSERVDQRVLQVIYELPDDRPVDVYIGEQMDVYLKAVVPSSSVDGSLDGEEVKLPFEEEPITREGVKPAA